MERIHVIVHQITSMHDTQTHIRTKLEQVFTPIEGCEMYVLNCLETSLDI